MSTAAIIPPDEQEMLANDLGGFVHDPLGAVLYGFPWDEGELEGLHGPRSWQREVLEDIGEHFSNPVTRFKVWRGVVSAGTGPGKSTLAAWIAWWGKSTYPGCRVIVTANTKAQLTTKTQPEFSKWFRMALNADWFNVHTESIKFSDAESEQNWRTDFMAWSEANPQAFAGGHNARKRIIFICDESSEISDTVFEVIERGLTDANTEIILLLIGNPTRNVGKFYDVAFGKPDVRWKRWIIDTREVEGISLDEALAALALYGEDSDTFRIGWRGLPPRSGSGQFIGMDRITGAQRRAVRVLGDEPLVAGVDFAWGGIDNNIVRFRRGLDARFIKPIKILGQHTEDPAVMTGHLADVLNTVYECADGSRRKVTMLFFDSAGIAAPVEARLRALGHKNIMVVNFGADSPQPTCAYFRDFMWNEMKQWLPNGAIDADPELEADLSGPVLVTSHPPGKIKLESKDEMKARLKKLGKAGKSPDNGDALALTFAHVVLPKKDDVVPPPQAPRNDSLGWMG